MSCCHCGHVVHVSWHESVIYQHSHLSHKAVASKLHGCCRCCITYLQVLIKLEIMPQGDAPPSLELAPGFEAPMPTEYASMKEYIETALPAESPIMYGMHTNAELSLLTSQVTTSYPCFTFQPQICLLLLLQQSRMAEHVSWNIFG